MELFTRFIYGIFKGIYLFFKYSYLLLFLIFTTLFHYLFKKKSKVKRLVLPEPVACFMNLSEDNFKQLMDTDKSLLSIYFNKTFEYDKSNLHTCDVLFIYCTIDKSGKIINESRTLREIIRDMHAPIVIIATENEMVSYIAAGKQCGYGQANLVMTLERKSECFVNFYSKLFNDMKTGTTMPVAWVKLAPQIPNHEHKNCPNAIFSMECGQISFK
jgi:hypothetical protein